MFQVIIYFEISHRDYTTIINEGEEKYRRSKDMRMKVVMQNKSSDAEKDKLVEGGNRIGINEIIIQNSCNKESKKKFWNTYAK